MIADHRGGLCLLIQRVKEALEMGSDVNDDSRNRHRPLQLALRRRYTQIAKLLIDHGADIHSKDRSGLDPIHTAINHGEFEVACYLISRGAKFNALPDLAYDYSKWYAFLMSR